ncbi:uncharacterized protein LOC141763614 [Sebastes fasciatus]|uniref:uncharacterized protein LOC141763614 n=1 Tax=Sebastes fasciatus TaxID=394691 RepID=UPI003D9EF818
MSCSCCCCVTPSGIRKKERLVRWEEEEEEEEEEEQDKEEEQSRRNMDISLLREQYRCTRETQRRRTQVLLFRTVSDELAEAVSIIAVTQGLTSPWEPNGGSPPAVTFDPDPTNGCDPWHVHLDLHRRCRPGVSAQLAASSPETTNTNSSSRRSSSSSESGGRNLSVDSTSDSPCSSFCSAKEEVPTDRSTGDPDTGSSRGDPDTGSSVRSRGDPEKMDPVQVSVSDSLDSSEQHSRSDVSEQVPPSSERSAAGSDESTTPVASTTCSPSSSTTSLHEDLNPSAGRTTTSNGVLQTSSTTSAWRGSRKFSAPALRFTRQLSVGGVGSSAGVHQNQNYHPFPNRKTPRISEAARRLGMYSSF